jgi:hypothetical protein
MRLKYEIKKAFSDENDVCLFADVTIGGIAVLSSAWHHSEATKISSLKVVFDPPPLTEGKAA